MQTKSFSKFNLISILLKLIIATANEAIAKITYILQDQYKYANKLICKITFSDES